ncbi:MAG: hypothetical protein ACJ8AT_09365 [Hyalangium sp.]|uniref:hypothetical protein n=1 Tax=Hyalangium sp. TaxID=2028555 RepID=UPI00389A9EE5
MRNVMLAVVGLVGLVLLCGSGVLLAQSDTTNPGNAVDADAADSRLQGMSTQGTSEGGLRVSFGTSGVGGSETSSGTGPTSGTGGNGTVGTSDTAGPGATAGPGSLASGAGQTVGAAGTGTTGLSQSVQQLQQEVTQMRQELAQLRAQLDNVSANTGVGGSGQAGVAPSGSSSGAAANPSTASNGTAPQGAAVAGGTSSGTPLRAGTAQETGARSTAAQGEAVVNAIYTGRVRSVSAGRLVLVDEAGKPFTVELGDKTRVLRKGQRISAQELKEGTRVRAVVDMLSGHSQATEVTTLPTK